MKLLTDEERKVLHEQIRKANIELEKASHIEVAKRYIDGL